LQQQNIQVSKKRYEIKQQKKKRINTKSQPMRYLIKATDVLIGHLKDRKIFKARYFDNIH